MKKLTPLLFILIAIALLSSCKPANDIKVPGNEEVILNDISFGTHPLQKMDVYLPKQRNANTKVIIYIHGGGWFMGDKSEIKEGAVYFQQQGFTFISINYRLTRTLENNIHPAQILDIDNAINLIIAKSKEWNISDSKLTFLGR